MKVVRVLHEVISVKAFGAVCGGRADAGIPSLARDVPLGRVGGKLDFHGVLKPGRGVEKFIHELLDVFTVYPCGPQPHVYLVRLQLPGHGRLEGRYIVPVNLRLLLRVVSRYAEFFPDIAGQVLAGGLVTKGFFVTVYLGLFRIWEYYPFQVIEQFFALHAGEG